VELVRRLRPSVLLDFGHLVTGAKSRLLSTPLLQYMLQHLALTMTSWDARFQRELNGRAATAHTHAWEPGLNSPLVIAGSAALYEYIKESEGNVPDCMFDDIDVWCPNRAYPNHIRWVFAKRAFTLLGVRMLMANANLADSHSYGDTHGLDEHIGQLRDHQLQDQGHPTRGPLDGQLEWQERVHFPYSVWQRQRSVRDIQTKCVATQVLDVLYSCDDPLLLNRSSLVLY
jgi:hypothetical protein